MTADEVHQRHLDLKSLMNKNLDSEEILKHVNMRVEDKVLNGDISGLDVPKQLSRIRSEIDELKQSLSNPRLKES